VRGQFLLQFAHPGRRGRGNHDLQVRQAGFQCADKVRANVNFAHADGVHPEHLTIGNGLLEFRVVHPETLAETGLPIAAPPHAHKVVRRRKNKKYRKKNVINDSHFD
jgi:hypothetical protein